jgi:tetratricopeptide (TPR) repeat protein
LKIAVYTIAKNEESFIRAWVESAKDADFLLIADTGSTDGTVELARSLGVTVIEVGISPWRFDDARNASLAAIPLDITWCIALDMDEELQPGWRKAIEDCKPQATRLRYSYTWSWNPDGTPGLTYGGDKIHLRKGYRWKHPVHETLKTVDEVQEWVSMEIHHHPDDSKSRAQYGPLLALSVKEDPLDDRNAFYYGRELFFQRNFKDAAIELKRHLALPTANWAPERAASMRYLAKCEPENAESWLLKAIATAPGRREPLVEIATFYQLSEQWDLSLRYSLEALEIKEKPLEYICDADAWSDLPFDNASLASFKLGLFKQAVEHGKAALAIAPDNARLIRNQVFYVSAFNSSLAD